MAPMKARMVGDRVRAAVSSAESISDGVVALLGVTFTTGHFALETDTIAKLMRAFLGKHVGS